MSRFADYIAELDAGRGELTWVVECYSRPGTLLATTKEAEAGDAFVWAVNPGSISLGPGRVSARTGSIEVAVSDHATLIPKVGGMLHPKSENRIRFSTGWERADGSTVLWPVATMVITEAKLRNLVPGGQGEGGPVLSLALADTLDPLRGELEHTFDMVDGEPVADVVGRLLGLVLDESEFVVASTGDFDVPAGRYNPGQSLIGVVADLLKGVGQEITTDPYGLVITRPILPTGENLSEERWRYGTGGGIPIEDLTRSWEARPRQGWKVEGASFMSGTITASIMVVDTDPTSEGYWAPEGRTRSIGSSRLPMVRTIQQAAVAGYGQLREAGFGPAQVEFYTVPNPAMREGDLIDLGDDGANASGTYRVRGFDMPPGVARMRIRARQVYDPEIGFDLPFSPGEGGVATFTDSFDRANGNLENLPGSPGSDNWTEVHWSWGIWNNTAVQRYPNGWSLAYPNTPVNTLDHRAVLKVKTVPAGKRIGPVVRFSGGGRIDGYAALVDSTGRITLEVWSSDSSVATLGSFSVGGSIEGKDLKLEADGSTLRVFVDTDQVITASDSRLNGSFAGMLGWGGVEGVDAPAADSFQIQEV